MSNKYWVGGGSSTNIDAVAPTNWADTDGGANNATAPTSSDDVFYNSNSGSGISIWNISFNWRSINCTGFTGTIKHNASVNASIGDATAGAGNIALKMVVGMTYQIMHPQTSKILFISTSATQQTIDWGGHLYGNSDYDGLGGSWIWNDDHISSFLGLNGTVDLLRGALDTNGKNYTGGRFGGSNSNVRTLTMGASQFYLYGVGNNCWMFATITNLTVTANTAKIWLYRSLTCFAPLIQSGTKDWGGLKVEFIGGGIATIASGGNPTFGEKIVNGGVDLGDGREDRYQQNNSWTSIGAVQFNGFNSTRRLRIHSNGGVRTVTVPNGTSVTGKYVDIQNTSLSISNNLSGIEGGAGDMGGNTNIVFDASVTKYFYAPTTGVKNYNDPQYWFLGSGGTGGQTTAPLPQDDVIFDANSFPVAGIIVRNGVGCERLGRHINWTGVLNNPQWDFQVDVINYGSLTFSPNMSVTSYADAFFTMFGSGASQFFTVDFAGLQIPHTLFLINFASTNTCTLQSDFVGNAANTTLFQTTGLIVTNNKNITTGRFTQSSGTLTLGASVITLKGVGTIWSSSGTLVSGTSEIIIDSQNATAKTFTGGSKVYNKLTLQGNHNDTITFSGNNTFGNTNITKTSAFAWIFTAGSTTTFSGTITKTTGALWTLNSTTTSIFTWTKTSGSITFVDVILSKSTAGGGATFTANTNSIDAGGNTGWSGFVTNPFTWTNGDADNDYNNPLNWFGGNVPTVTDTAVFSAVSVANCTVPDGIAFSVKGLLLTVGYTGIITSLGDQNMNIGSDGIVIRGGTLTTTGNPFVYGSIVMSNGTLILNSPALEVESQGSVIPTINITGGTLTHNNNTVVINGTLEAIVNTTSGRPFGNLTFFAGITYSGTSFVALTLQILPNAILNADVSVSGDYSGSNSITGTGIIRLIGSATRNLGGGNIPNLQFNCTNTVTLIADVTVDNTLTLTAVPTVNGFTIKCKGNIATAVATIAGTTNTSIEGTYWEQIISGAGVLIGNVTVNKSSGLARLNSHMAPMYTGKNFTVTQGQFNTNNFNIVFNNDLIVDESTGGLYFETLGTTTIINGTLTGRKISRQKLFVGASTL